MIGLKIFGFARKKDMKIQGINIEIVSPLLLLADTLPGQNILFYSFLSSFIKDFHVAQAEPEFVIFSQ